MSFAGSDHLDAALASGSNLEQAFNARLKDELQKVINDLESKIEDVRKGSVSILEGQVIFAIPGPTPMAMVRMSDSVAGVKPGSELIQVPLLVTGGGGMETHSLVTPGQTVVILAQGTYKVAIATHPTLAWGPKATLAASYAVGVDILNPLNFIQCLPGGVLQISIPPNQIVIDPTGIKILASSLMVESTSVIQICGTTKVVAAGTVAKQAASVVENANVQTTYKLTENNTVTGAKTETLSTELSNAGFRQM